MISTGIIFYVFGFYLLISSIDTLFFRKKNKNMSLIISEDSFFYDIFSISSFFVVINFTLILYSLNIFAVSSTILILVINFFAISKYQIKSIEKIDYRFIKKEKTISNEKSRSYCFKGWSYFAFSILFIVFGLCSSKNIPFNTDIFYYMFCVQSFIIGLSIIIISINSSKIDNGSLIVSMFLSTEYLIYASFLYIAPIVLSKIMYGPMVVVFYLLVVFVCYIVKRDPSYSSIIYIYDSSKSFIESLYDIKNSKILLFLTGLSISILSIGFFP